MDHRADIYVWGVLAYELLAGRHPFAHRTSAQQLMSAHVAESPMPLARARDGLPTALVVLVDQCLAKAPGARVQSGAGRPAVAALVARR